MDLAEARMRANKTQAEVAEELQVTQGAVSHWEVGYNIPPHTRYFLAKSLGMTEEQLTEAAAETKRKFGR